MNKIKKDFLGLYTIAGGYIARPTGETEFKEGEKVETHHFGGTCVCGIGKDENCKKGSYLEYWLTSDAISMGYKSLDERTKREKWNWYLKNASFQIPLGKTRVDKEKISQETIRRLKEVQQKREGGET